MKKRHVYALKTLLPVIKGTISSIESIRSECEVGTGDIANTSDIIFSLKQAERAINFILDENL